MTSEQENMMANTQEIIFPCAHCSVEDLETWILMEEQAIAEEETQMVQMMVQMLAMELAFSKQYVKGFVEEPPRNATVENTSDSKELLCNIEDTLEGQIRGKNPCRKATPDTNHVLPEKAKWSWRKRLYERTDVMTNKGMENHEKWRKILWTG